MDAKENVRKQIVRELQVGHECNSPYVIKYYGAFQNEARDIVLCMEYMDCGYVFDRHIKNHNLTCVVLSIEFPKTSDLFVWMSWARLRNLYWVV